MVRSLVSETRDRWLLIKGRIGGVTFWRAVARFIRPGTWKGRALRLHSKAYMYLIPAEAVDIVPGYITSSYAMWVYSPRLVYWPAKELTIIKEGDPDYDYTDWKLKIILTDPFETKEYDVTPNPWWKRTTVSDTKDHSR